MEASSENFHKSKSGKFGFASKCKICKAEVNRLSDIKHKDKRQAWRDSHKEEKRLYDKQYVQDNIEYIKERNKQYYQENREDILEKERIKALTPEFKKRRKEYRETRKERDKELRKQWMENNKERVRELKKNRYHRERSVEQGFTIDDWHNCKSLFENSCAYCGEFTNDLTQDHFIPVSKNGGYTLDNIIPSCRSCNSSKCNTDFEDWYCWQEFYSIDREDFLLEYLGYELDQ